MHVAAAGVNAQDRPSAIRRYAVTVEPMQSAPPGGLQDFPRQDIVLIAGEAPGLKSALTAAITGHNLRVRQVVWGEMTGQDGDNRFTLAALPENSLTVLKSLICPSGERVGAIINLAGFAETANTGREKPDGVLGFFTLLKTFEADIRESAREGGGLIFNITPLGGRFGLRPANDRFSEEAAGTLGVAKSAAREWPDARIRCIDLDPAMETEMTAAMLWEEMSTGSSVPETGIDRQGRRQIALMEKPCSGGGIRIDSESVILLLGGASGITGAIAHVLAKRYRPRMILVGRTHLPDVEPPETAWMIDGKALRSFFIRTAGEEKNPPTPAEIDRQIDRILKRRQLMENLESLKASGAGVEYRQLDVRDSAAMERLVEETYRRYGRIDGVVHGAGIIEDRRIRDKSPDSFMAVYNTKVIPARVFAQTLNPATLKFMVFFSSVVARFGNAGQCDYSGANEVLNKLAACLAGKWTKTRVVSIGWGPWEMGMVNDRLKRKYKDQGIDLISKDAGIDFFFNELGTEPGDDPEIVATSAPWKNA